MIMSKAFIEVETIRDYGIKQEEWVTYKEQMMSKDG